MVLLQVILPLLELCTFFGSSAAAFSEHNSFLFGQDRGNSVQINSTLFLITDQAATASKARRFELPENPSGRAISEELMILEL